MSKARVMIYRAPLNAQDGPPRRIGIAVLDVMKSCLGWPRVVTPPRQPGSPGPFLDYHEPDPVMVVEVGDKKYIVRSARATNAGLGAEYEVVIHHNNPEIFVPPRGYNTVRLEWQDTDYR
jgi:hypothetical protein